MLRNTLPGKDVALITDERFSSGSHGFVVGHVTPGAYVGGKIALMKNGDSITMRLIWRIQENGIERVGRG